MIQNEAVRGLAEHSRVTDEQKLFLELYEDCLDINKAARDSGLTSGNIRRALRANTPFAKLFRRLTSDLDTDPRFNKIGSLSMLIELKERAKAEGKLDLEFKVIQEINKMIEGNIAATKKVVENVKLEVGAVIDLTKPVSNGKTIDIHHEEIN